MRLVSISPSRDKTVEIHGVVKDFSKGETAFIVVANAVVLWESEYYEETRMMMDVILSLNSKPKMEILQ